MAVWQLGSSGQGQEPGVQVTKDPATGWEVYSIQKGNTVAKLVPSAGCNVFSIQVDGTEFFHGPESLKDLPGFAYGNPVIYPMPNRVRDAKLVHEGKTYTFPANNGPNFLHGLVHSVPWTVTSVVSDEQSSSVECEYRFAPGTDALKLFPFPHVVRLKTEVRPGSVRFTYTVDNSQGTLPVPFGMCYHPYFKYLGERKQTFLTVPATSHMEAVDLLPTGKLESLDGSSFDARKPVCLEGFVIDDVYAGMKPELPAVIEFRDKQRRVELHASADFGHMVVYTPEGRPFLCVENQTCSTDAHNLNAQGKNEVANLLTCPVGKTLSGYAEFRFSK